MFEGINMKNKIEEKILKEIESWVKSWGAIPRTDSYAKGWNECRKELYQGWLRCKKLIEKR